jgi:hypothetical protein
MNPFKVGDRVKAIQRGDDLKLIIGKVYTVKEAPCACHVKITNNRSGMYYTERFVLFKKGKEMSNTVRYFRQKKDSINVKKGAIWKLNAYDKRYWLIKETDVKSGILDAKFMEQPKWFEEVFLIAPAYATEAEIKKLKLKKVRQ